jgi:NO-binding membrane sensor protein with MHYT domain
MPPKEPDECTLHSGLQTEIDHLKESDVRQWEAITELQKRLPVWATIIISLLTFLLGCALTYAALAVRLAGK